MERKNTELYSPTEKSLITFADENDISFERVASSAARYVTYFMLGKPELFDKVKGFLKEIDSDVNEYLSNFLKRSGDENFKPGGCSRVAMDANFHIFFNNKNISDKDFVSGNLDVRAPGSGSLTFFSGKGFHNHIMNFVELSDGTCIAIDFTSPYNMFEDKMNTKKDQLFVVAGKSKEEIEQILKKLYVTDRNN